jgi:hypothetical protein
VKDAELLKFLHFTDIKLSSKHRESQLATKGNLSDSGTRLSSTRSGDVSDSQLSNAVIVYYDSDDNTDIGPIIEDYTSKKQSVIVYALWHHAVSSSNKYMVKQWIDDGAKLIVGSGSETIGPLETYSNTPIIYSLGSFLPSTKLTRNHGGLVATVVFKSGQTDLVMSLLNFKSGKPVLDRTEAGTNYLLKLAPTLARQLSDEKGGLKYTFKH